MAINSKDVIHPRLSFVGAEIFTQFWFMAHNFGSRYARKSIKRSKDADHSLVSKQNWAKKRLIGLAPRAWWSWQKKRKNTHHLLCLPREPQIKNEKKIFRSQLEDFMNPWMVWTAL